MMNDKPIFVVGSPRTGTTLVKGILNRSPEIHLFNELHYFEKFWDLRRRYGTLETRDSLAALLEPVRARVMFSEKLPELESVLTPEGIRPILEKYGGGYPGVLAAVLQQVAKARGKRVWGDSSPQDVLYIPTILRWFPGARIVGLIRDPRGFLASYKNYDLRDSHYGKRPKKRYNLFSNSLLWRSYMSALLEAEKEPWGSAVFRLRYEDLVTAPEEWVRKLCDHIGVDYDPVMIDVDQSNSSYVGRGGPQRGITPQSRDRWRTELTPTEIWLGQRMVGKTMTALGYEKLSGVSPSPGALVKTLIQLPAWFFRLLSRGEKPFSLARIRRVLSLGFRR